MEQTIDVVAERAEPAAQRRTRRLAPAVESSLVRLRIRWPWILVAAILGGMVGILLTRGLVTYETTATVQISDSSQDSTRVKQVAQTVERTATSSTVVEGAADVRGESESDLAARLTALWETDTDVIHITVRGTDPKGIVKDANAVVSSLSDFYDRQTRAQIKSLSEQGDELLTSGRLDDPSAEATRRSGVGSAVAAQQGSAAAGWTTVTLLDPASVALPTGLSTSVAVVLGAFVGIAVSAGLALILPFRRRKIRRASEVGVLLPGTRGITAADNGAAEVAGLFLESERADLAIVATEGTQEAAAAFSADVVTLLQAHGVSVAIAEAADSRDRSMAHAGAPGGQAPPQSQGNHSSLNGHGSLNSFRFLGRAGRAEKRKELGVQTLVLVTTAQTGPLSLLSGQGEVLAVVIARSRRHTVKQLTALVTQLRHSDPTVVLVS